MTERNDDRIGPLLRASVASTADLAHERDLWPYVLGRIRQGQSVSPADVALLGGLLLLAPFFPRALLFLVCSV